MSKPDTQPQVAPGVIRVETAKTVQGPASTTISVEVDETNLGRQGADANRAERAVAVVSRTKDGKEEWSEQELIQSGRRVTDDQRVLKTFNATVADGEVSASGVAVKVETPTGSVWANEQNKPGATRDVDKAEPAKPKS